MESNIREAKLTTNSLEIIETFDLDCIKAMISRTRELADKEIIYGEEEYRKFLKLVYLFPDERIVPSVIMDLFWHTHILDTRKYHKDSMLIFGYYLHHNPHFGSSEGKENIDAAFIKTAKLYYIVFNQQLVEIKSTCSGSGSDGDSYCASTNDE